MICVYFTLSDQEKFLVVVFLNDEVILMLKSQGPKINQPCENWGMSVP